MRFRVTKVIDFCYGHRLMNYDGACANLHGHNARVEVDVSSNELDTLGMVVDFKQIREVVKSWIDAHLDHKLLLCKDDPVVPSLEKLGEPMFLMDDNPTAENICRLIFAQVRLNGLAVSEVRLWETPAGLASCSSE